MIISAYLAHKFKDKNYLAFVPLELLIEVIVIFMFLYSMDIIHWEG